MTHFKTLMIAAALMAVPAGAFAQVSTDAATDVVKEKAIDTVMDNLTTEDAVIAGTTMLKGGTKEDAAIAVVKGRADAKIEAITGGVSIGDVPMGEVSKDGVMDAGKAMAMEKAKAMSLEKAKMNAETWGMSDREKAKMKIKSGAPHVIHKSGAEMPAMPQAAPTLPPMNCPAGTKDAGDGTCMITGDWKP